MIHAIPETLQPGANQRRVQSAVQQLWHQPISKINQSVTSLLPGVRFNMECAGVENTWHEIWLQQRAAAPSASNDLKFFLAFVFVPPLFRVYSTALLPMRNSFGSNMNIKRHHILEIFYYFLTKTKKERKPHPLKQSMSRPKYALKNNHKNRKPQQ